MNRVLVIGLGGIGSQLVEPLARYLQSAALCRDVVLVDGDAYSQDNRDRQRMREIDAGQNKAEVQARHLQALFPGLTVAPFPEYAGEENVGDIVREDDAVFLCVDNHATRKLVSDRAKRLRNVLLISAGNEYSDGNVQVYSKVNGREKTAPLDKHHREIRFPRDQNPAELSCEELARLPHGGQVVFANLTAATLALNAFYAVTHSFAVYGEVYFDILANKANPVARR